MPISGEAGSVPEPMVEISLQNTEQVTAAEPVAGQQPALYTHPANATDDTNDALAFSAGSTSRARFHVPGSDAPSVSLAQIGSDPKHLTTSSQSADAMVAQDTTQLVDDVQVQEGMHLTVPTVLLLLFAPDSCRLQFTTPLREGLSRGQAAVDA